MKKVNSRRSSLVLTIVFLSFFLSGCNGAKDQTGFSTERSRSVVEKKFEEWKTGKANFFDLLADNVVWEVSGRSPVSGLYQGKDDFLDRAVKPITDKLKTRIVPELISLTADDKYIWLHWRGKAVSLKGQSYENKYVWKLEVKNDKIVSGVAFLDTYELNKLLEEN